MNARDSGLGGSRTHPASDGLVIGKRSAGTRVNSADGQIIHGTGGSSWNSIWNSFRQRSQQDVHDARRSLDVTAGNRGGWVGVHNCPPGSDYPDGPHQSGGGRDIVGQQTTKDIEAGRVGDCLDGIHAAFDLRITSGEIDGSDGAPIGGA